MKLTTYVFEDLAGTIDPPATAEGLAQTVSLATPGQTARYSVAMDAGDKVALKTENSNMTGSYEIKWLNPSGSAVYTETWNAKENWFWDSKEFTTAGTWTLLVDPREGVTGSVDLRLWETPDLGGQTIAPSTGGGSVTSTIGIPGQRELITFAGSKGQKLAWLLSQSTISAGGTLSLLQPNGATLLSSGFSSFQDPVTLPETGTYTFVVDPAVTGQTAVANGTGSVKITAYLVEDVAGTIDPPATAEGVKQEVSLTTPGQVARYSVTAAAGDKVALKTENSNMTGSYQIKWLNPSGSAVYTETWNPKENWFWDSKALSTAGTWTLLVDPVGTTTGSVDLRLWETPDVTGQTITPSTAGGSAAATISIPGQRELITFSGSKDQRISWTSSESTISAGGTIALLRPNGTTLASGGFSNFQEPLTLPETGPYTFVVDAAVTGQGSVTNGIGSVKLTAYTVEDVAGTIDPPATAEGVKQTVSIGTPGQVARYGVTMAAGDKVALKTENSNMTGSYQIKWLNPSGSAVYTETWNPKENWFWDSKDFATAGNWTLLVDPVGNATGSVDLRFWETPDVTGQTIAPAVEGGSATATISIPGQRELITFSGSKDQQISWTSSESTIGQGGTIALLRPNGAELASVNFSTFRDAVTLPEAGTYTFVVNPAVTGTGSVANGVGSIKLTAYLVNDATGTITPPATAEGVKQTFSISAPGQNARYSVTMAAGDKVSLRTSNSNLTNSYTIKWINPSGSAVYSETWGAKENWFWDSKTFSTAGTWTLLVDPVGSATGSVDLLLWKTPDVTGQTIAPSTEGGSATSTVDVPGQRELITFSGTASQLITLKAQESTIANGSAWILKPDGSQLSGSDVTFSSSSSGKKEVTLPSTGTYTIVVDPPPTGANPVTNGTGSVLVTVYLGSHAAWWGGEEAELRLVDYSPGEEDESALAVTYSDVPSDGSDGASPVSREEAAPKGQSASLPYGWVPVEQGSWLPPRAEQERNWLVGRSSSPWLDVEPLEVAGETTALAGQALAVDGLPAAGVSVSIEGTSVSARTDEAGRFLLEGAPAGHQVLRIDGESAPGKKRYGIYEVGVDLEAGKTIVLDYTVWLTPLDLAGDLVVDSPTKREVSLRTPRVPGLEVKIPAGTRITDDEGRAVEDLNITAIPLDRPPFPLPPFVTVPVYFTVQPGGASLSKGARFVYPNWGEMAPGSRVDFWNYDPDDRGWYVYGRGTVTPDGEQVVPDAGVRVWEFTGAMAVSGPTPPGTGPHHEANASDGDPVDLYTGLFTYGKTDMTLPDVVPISIERTYRPNDSNSYAFGEGMTNLYDLRLWPIVNYKEADLILPDGGRVHYVRTSAGTGWTTAVYEPTGDAGMFDGSTISWNGVGWDMKLANGFTFTFGGFAPLVAIKDPHGNTLRIKRTEGQTGNIKEIVSPNGRWAKFTYDGANRITEITDNGGRSFKYSYTSGRLTKVERSGGRTTEYEYDGSGRMKAVINPRGNKYLQNEYDANGRVKKQTTGDGGSFEFAYELDGAGKVKATTVTDPRGYQRKVSFDAEGFPVSEIEALGTEAAQTTTWKRQPETGLILSQTDPLGRKTEFEYDSVGNVKEVTRLAGTEDEVTTKIEYEPGTTNVTKVTDPLGHATALDYGPKGELLTRTDALENVTTFSYNGEGLPTTLGDPEDGETKFVYQDGDLVAVTDPLGRTTSQFVDALGRARAITSPNGQQSVLSYDEADRVTSITSPSGAQTTFGYDKDGNLISLEDPRGNETTMTYDAMDRLESQTNPLEDTAEWNYDKAGLLIESISLGGDVTKYSYDELGRLAKVRFKVEGLLAQSTIEYEYDDGDRLIGVNDSASGEYVLEYDDLDRLTSISGPTGTVGYAYDDAGRRTSMWVPGQPALAYEYDDANRLIEVSRSGDSVLLAYDDASRLTNLELPNGIQQIYEYDKAGQATSITYKKGQTTLGDIKYAYDANGRTEAIWGSYARLVVPAALGTGTFNAANQLTKRGAEEFAYDDDGNLIEDGSNEYSWNARGQLTGITGGTTASFGYDPFGRRISKTLGGTTTKMIYDGPNVVQESVGGSVTANLINGLRIDQVFSRATSTGTDSYLTDQLGSTVALADGGGEVDTTYAYEPFGKVSSAGAASDNPFQFTGRENDGTGLQFNRARYYDPTSGRFISPDPLGFEGSGANLYGYAAGAPLTFTDPLGEYAWLNKWPDPMGWLEDKVSEGMSEIGRLLWEHRRELLGAGVGITCALSGGTTCLIVAGSGAALAAFDAGLSNECGSDITAALTAGATTIIMALPGLPLVTLEAAGKVSLGLNAPQRLGLAAPGEIVGIGGGPVVEEGINEHFQGGSAETSSC
ncbi:MAG: DUF6531 domain-containing protein [Actinomycetota bacterium]|nr:DUF6531 domain-containing protein [Actinomycetota bacterium]